MPSQSQRRSVPVTRQASGHVCAHKVSQHDSDHLGRYAETFARDYNADVRHREIGRTDGKWLFCNNLGHVYVISDN